MIERKKAGIFRNQTVEEAVYYDQAPMGAQVTLDLMRNPHLKPYAEGVLRKIAGMLASSENDPVPIIAEQDAFIYYYIDMPPSAGKDIYLGFGYLKKMCT